MYYILAGPKPKGEALPFDLLQVWLDMEVAAGQSAG